MILSFLAGGQSGSAVLQAVGQRGRAGPVSAFDLVHGPESVEAITRIKKKFWKLGATARWTAGSGTWARMRLCPEELR
jgi:hypothetical protein